MADKAYQDRNLLYELYVKRRMTMTGIQRYFEDKYDVVVTSQTIYNYLKKYDLLKFRGKGRKSTTKGRPKLSPAAAAAAKIKRDRRQAMKAKAARKVR